VDDGAGYGAGNQLELVSDNLNVVEGAGSDLDADLLDGQEGEYYVDWNNLTNAPNQPPVAILQVDESVLYLGEGGQVGANMNLALSYDPEGGPLSYTFDPAGRGQGLPVDFQSSPRAGASFALPGDYLVAGWVQDGAGAVNRAQALVSVYRFGSTLVDSAGNVGLNASLAVANGRPAIAYPDYSAGNLRYSRALDAAGASWSTPVTVDSGGLVGLSASLTVVDNRPAIAYWNASNDGLKYARASDAAGTSWDTPLTVDSDGHVGEYASLAVVDGRPAIAYFDAFNDDLKYVRASDAAGTSWGTPVTVDGAGAVGTYASLAVVDGRPAIAYYDDFPNQDLKYVIASDAAGTSWETPLTVDSAGAVGWRAPLAVVDGRPAIAYWNASNGDLKYVRAQNATGSRWGTPLTLDSAGDVGRSASLAVVDGRPAITYFDNTNGDLRFTIPRQD
jgi:hypothetical protein